MEFIKKFAKEISVFGLVLVVFLGLFIYRQATYATYKTVNASVVEKAIFPVLLPFPQLIKRMMVK